VKKWIVSIGLAVAVTSATIPAAPQGPAHADARAAMVSASQPGQSSLLSTRLDSGRLTLAGLEPAALGFPSGVCSATPADVRRPADISAGRERPRSTLISLGCLMTI
jgi:hypothetical protein